MPFPYKKMDEKDFEYIRSVTESARVWVGDDISEEYFHDEMPEYGVFKPELYVEVKDKYEVSAIMKYAYENNIPVTARGAGTGLAGGASCKYGGIMLSLMRMNRIYDVDTKNMSVCAEPGARVFEVAEAAKKAGLFYPPDPGEKNASIGGSVITNAGGMRAVRYGVTRDYVRSIEAVMPNGEIMQFSSNVVKNTTGPDIKDLVVGSEGIFCICTKVTLKLIPAPKFSCTLVIPFEDNESCIECVPVLLKLPFCPTATEFLERELIELVEKNMDKKLPVREGKAVLIVMFDASTEEELTLCCEAAAEAVLDRGAIDVFVADTEKRIKEVWDVRGAVLEAMKISSLAQEECDVVVPRAEIANFVKAAKKICGSYGIEVQVCGHAGDGNIHTELLRKEGMTDKEWEENTCLCLKELYAKSKELGGQLSGEHGIGNGRIEYFREFIGEPMWELYKSIKLAFDPKLILNPGKIIEF
ncbi:MAG: FAD-binding oxidoreductase [Firmicutes bacterium]|nr:FAD-binding oxidoreductase [Bacillota bacterium]